MRAVVLLALVCFFCLADQGCALFGLGKKKPNISANIKKDPWQAKVTFKFGNKLKQCGGSLISNQWVVTSAYCLSQAREALISLDLNKSPPLNLNSTYIVYHPRFKSNNFNNDIALLRLPAAVSNSNIKPIKLPSYSQNGTSFVNNMTYISDWTEHKDNKTITQRVISNIECKRFYKGQTVTQTTLCTRNYNNPLESTCNATAGNALVLKEKNVHKQIGIVSFTLTNDCTHGAPIGYTRISQYLLWISSVTGIKIAQK